MDESIARKLAVPKKLSNWEREKQAAEAKKREQDEEAAAALKDFEESLGVDDDDGQRHRRRGGRPPAGIRDTHSAVRHGPGYHRGPDPPRRGYGGDAYDGAPNMKRKRAIDEARDTQPRRYDDRPTRHDRRTPSPEYEAPKPKVYLQSLPVGITKDELKALITPHLKVHSLSLNERTPGTAVATLTSDTNLTQIDNAVRTLKDRYISRGHRLAISRFDEGAFNQRMAAPFGATPVAAPAQSLNYAPPPSERDFDRRSNDRRGRVRERVEVKVGLPLNIATVQAVHSIADKLLAEPNADRAMALEALLMKMPEVQADERFSFLYESSSPAGVYYRYCLWAGKANHKGRTRIHDDSEIDWDISTQGATFRNLSDLSQIVTHSDYASSDEESDGEDERKRPADRLEPENLLVETERNFLLPLQHAKLTHLLARLPKSNTTLRIGDVARVTNFAIRHAAHGAAQIVDKLLLNVDIPFCTTSAAKAEEPSSDDEDVAMSNDDEEAASKQTDSSAPRLVALYIISDILSASATAGARNSWKYRQLFEAGFTQLKTFEKLGTIDRELGWGRMKLDQWKRKIGAIFDLWEGWSVFSAEALQGFRRALNGEAAPEPLPAEQPDEEMEVRKPKWMTVKVAEKVEKDGHLVALPLDGKDKKEVELPSDVKDKTETKPPLKVKDEKDIGLEARAAVPASDSATVDKPGEKNQGSAESKTAAQAETTSTSSPAWKPAQQQAPAPKKRMRAEDMFASSDEEGN